MLRKYVEIHFPLSACNMRCSYCYIGQHDTKMKELKYSVEEIRSAFSQKRLGAGILISLCSDGETLIHPKMPAIIRTLLEEGHYVVVVTNGTMSNRIRECIEFPADLLERLFFKLSFHYEEMEKAHMLDVFFQNVKMLKESPCSFTVEYIVCDETWENINQFKEICMDGMGAYPHMNLPRDERRHNLGIHSIYSLKNFIKKYKELGIDSEFFTFREQLFGKKYKGFCYAGERSLWVNMGTGYSYQCYAQPPLQYFMDYNKPVKWLAIGKQCKSAHCYSNHAFMTLGVAPFPAGTEYCPSYAQVRDRKSVDGTYWLKPTYQKLFKETVCQDEYSDLKKYIVNRYNILLKWFRRRYPIKK